MGTWFDPEPGTNPGFLYQQNTVRDALVAGLSLNNFNNHADRVHVANIAQAVNVLQAMILTEGSKMLLTPTYHVFEMYKVHHGATLPPIELSGDVYAQGTKLTGTPGAPGYTSDMSAVQQISASASRDGAGKIHVSLCNLHHDQPAEVSCKLVGAAAGGATGRVLSGDRMNALNTFETDDTVKPVAFTDFTLSSLGLSIRLPARSVVVLELVWKARPWKKSAIHVAAGAMQPSASSPLRSNGCSPTIWHAARPARWSAIRRTPTDWQSAAIAATCVSLHLPPLWLLGRRSGKVVR